MYKLMNISYKCNNSLLTSFGLIGKFWPYAYKNTRATYCPTNEYSCCSGNQLTTSMNTFGKSMVNLRTDLEPILEISIALKTVEFVTFMSTWRNHQVCSNILSNQFKKNISAPDFSMKKFIKKFME